MRDSRQFTKPQMQQSPHLAGVVVFGLGRGNLNPFSKILIYNINIGFYFWLEYQLEYCTSLDYPFAFDLTTDCIGVDQHAS